MLSCTGYIYRFPSQGNIGPIKRIIKVAKFREKCKIPEEKSIVRHLPESLLKLAERVGKTEIVLF